MVKNCCVKFCKSESHRGCGISFHSFPANEDMKKKWLDAIPHVINSTKYSVVCGLHFKPNEFQNTPNSSLRIMLKADAVPSVFPVPSKQVSVSQTSSQPAIDSDTSSSEWLKIEKPLLRSTTVLQTPAKKLVSSVKDEAFQNNIKVYSGSVLNGSPVKKNIIKEESQSQNVPTDQENDSLENNKFLRNRSVRLKNRRAYLANRKCSVPHCNTRPSKEVSLHPCPNNAAVRNEWAEALRVGYQYVKNMVACSLHFKKIDFIHSSSGERALKHNAVPSRNLPHRKKLAIPIKHLKKVAPSKPFEGQGMMTDFVYGTKEEEQEEKRECRACLVKLDSKKSCCNVFQAWAPPWDGMEATIAEDLAKVANVEISITDRHSKVLCARCYKRLLDAASFASTVRSCDLLLRMRFTEEIDREKVWPKPIQVDKNINGAVLDIEIKQEVVSDEEYPANANDNVYVENELANVDIKIEPEEFSDPPPMNITINGTISLNPLNSENKDITNGPELNEATQFTEMTVKQEPQSEGEQEVEQAPDLPLECLLCAKSFNSVTGLKAHVIANHSYKSVKRKTDGSVSPEKRTCQKYQCAICRRNFHTSTDLMVHETCHNKHSCYSCMEKFDSFELLMRHRKRCKAVITKSVQKLKTLEDVKRPLPGIKDQEVVRNVLENIIEEEDSEMTDLSIDQRVLNIAQDQADNLQEIKSSDNYEASVNKEVGNPIEDMESVNKVTGSLNKEENEKVESLNETEESVIETAECVNETDESGNETIETVNEIAESEIDLVESIDKKVGSVNKESDCINKLASDEKKTDEDADSNMKLHFEIHSTKDKTDSTLVVADMEAETLQNDDCT